MKRKKNGRSRLKWMLGWSALQAGLICLACVVWLICKRRWSLTMDGTVPVLALAGLCAGGSLWLFRTRRSLLLQDVTSWARDLMQAQEQGCLELELPYALVDESGELVWQNREFEKIAGEKTDVRELFPELGGYDYGRTKQEELYVSREEKIYRLSWQRISLLADRPRQDTVVGASSLIGLFLYDETERIFCEQELEREKMVAGLIYLDNFEEALASIEEVRRSLLVALIDRKINRFFQNMEAIVRKTEVDKYFVVLKQKYIPGLKETRFSLLEEVKTVNVGNDMSVTLSIGLGANGADYLTNFTYARMAIDMALARGGDQAVIKDGDRIQYFGGKTPQAEKNTRVKARVKAHALRELVETKEHVIVMGHKLGDIDCFGAAIGIARAVTAIGKKTHIVINDVTTSVRPLMEAFTASHDYPEDLFLNGKQAAPLLTEEAVLIVVDVNRPSLCEEEALLPLAKTMVVLDHHRQSGEVIGSAVLSYVEPYASSTCELVAEILQYFSENVRIKALEANALYAGIVLDTNNFTTQTGVRTFEAAAFLKRSGADVVKVRKLFRDRMEDYKAKAEAVHNAEVFCDSYAISICPAVESESPTIIGAQAANELLNIVGIKASIVLTEYQNKIYISARSIDEVNVQLIMERLGGGGHLSTAGAQLIGCSLEEARALVMETVKQMIEDKDI